MSAFPQAPEARFQRDKGRVEVFLVEDHAYFRQGMRELLEANDPEITVVGDAGSAEQAVRLICDLQPDVVLMDIHLPGESGIDAIRRLALDCPLVHVLILSGSGTDANVVEAVLAGARGYLLKSAPMAEIVAGIHTAVDGGSVLSPGVATQLLDYVREARPGISDPVPHPRLTPREVEVLRLLAEGLENSRIADRLVISPRTARNHVASILAKLQMENRIQAAVYAVKNGLA
jgi:DNA-binding NarL/FixJ family response regulator